MGDINRLCLFCLQYTLNDHGTCGSCGSPSVAPTQSSHHMQPRSILAGKYMVAKVLGEGGFGITYLGWDINLEVKIAIKEYFPLGAATRNTTVSDQVSAPAGNAEEQYRQGQDRFIDEARRLAKLHSLPGIVAVKDFFLENGTAYIVMEFVEGVTLKCYLEQCGGRMPAANVLALMEPLIKSLAQIHRTGIIHRDISPDNIMVTPEGQLRLIDFGAARDFASDNKSMSVLLKPGYAPEEQYRSRGNQGPWTDIYALCATIYRAIEGEKPQEALERVLDDTLAGFSSPVPDGAAAAIMKGLTVRQEGRWQNLDEFYAALYQTAVPQKAPVPGPIPMAQTAVVPAPSPAESPLAASQAAASRATPLPEAGSPEQSAASPSPEAATKKKAKPIIAVAIVAVVLLAILIPAVVQNQGGAASTTQSAAESSTALSVTGNAIKGEIPNVVGMDIAEGVLTVNSAMAWDTQRVKYGFMYTNDAPVGQIIAQDNDSRSAYALRDLTTEEQEYTYIELTLSAGPRPDDLDSVYPVPLAWIDTVVGDNRPRLFHVIPPDERVERLMTAYSMDGGQTWYSMRNYAADDEWAISDGERILNFSWSPTIQHISGSLTGEISGKELKFAFATLPAADSGLLPSVYIMPGTVNLDFIAGEDIVCSGIEDADRQDYSEAILGEAFSDAENVQAVMSGERNLYRLSGNFKTGYVYSVGTAGSQGPMVHCVKDGELLYQSEGDWKKDDWGLQINRYIDIIGKGENYTIQLAKPATVGGKSAEIWNTPFDISPFDLPAGFATGNATETSGLGGTGVVISEPPDIQFMVDDIALLETTISEVSEKDYGSHASFEDDVTRYSFSSRDDTVVDFVVLQDTSMPFELLGKYRFGEAAPTLFTDFTGIADYHSLPTGDHILFDGDNKRLEAMIYEGGYYLDYTQGNKRVMISVEENIVVHFDMRHADIQ